VLVLVLFLTLKPKYVSHQPERFEKNCLNCGTDVAGRFCQHCGQENVPGHMPFLALIQHFIYDIFHFDGKFFDTLKLLFFKPGYVPLQYAQGKRLSYLDPIRMYLFTSAIFFLFFFATAGIGEIGNITGQDELTKAERYDVAARYNEDSVNLQTTGINPLQVLLDTNYVIATNLKKTKYFSFDSLYPIQWKQYGQLYAARKADKEEISITSNSKWLEKSLASK
jgi:hypothetical protein